nr:apolipoprotein N-acyltransferase [Pseudomonadota bacterium]
MRLISARIWALVVFSAILQLAIFPVAGPLPAWRSALSWFALVPFFLAILSPDRNGKSLPLLSTASLGYVCGILWYGGNCYWIYQTMYLYGGLPKPVAFTILVLFSLYLGLYHALFAVLVALAGRSRYGRLGALCLTPFAWVAVELARAHITGFPWDLLGNSQVDNLLITRIAPVAGVMGISFLVAAINAGLSSLFFVPRTGRTYMQAIAGIFALAILLIVNAGMHDVASSKKTTDYAIMMQENLSVGAVGREERPPSPVEELTSFSYLSVNPGYSYDLGQGALSFLRLPQGTHPTIIVWPEAPSHLQSNDPTFRAAMSRLATATGAPLIIGSLGVDFDPPSPRGY